MPLTDEEKERLFQAFMHLSSAKELLKKTVTELAKFGENVPKLNPTALEPILADITSVNFSIGFVQSFVRVSVLSQIVETKKPEN